MNVTAMKRGNASIKHLFYILDVCKTKGRLNLARLSFIAVDFSQRLNAMVSRQ